MVNSKIKGQNSGVQSTTEVLDVLSTGVASKLWRAKILLNRQKSPMIKDLSRDTYKGQDDFNHHLSKEGSYSTAQGQDAWNSMKILGNNNNITTQEVKESLATDHTAGKPISTLNRLNDIIIVNTNSSPAQSIVIQNRPKELRVEPGTTWASVKSFGRNNSFQIYTGSEDTISFEISWYSVMPNRVDVITKCRLLESWSKANGYNSSPPILNLLWGNSGLFDDHDFILTGAAYQLSNFQDACHDSNGGKIDLRLLPNSATQILTFKRVSMTNLGTQDILSNTPISGIPGIKI